MSGVRFGVRRLVRHFLSRCPVAEEFRRMHPVLDKYFDISRSSRGFLVFKEVLKDVKMICGTNQGLGEIHTRVVHRRGGMGFDCGEIARFSSGFEKKSINFSEISVNEGVFALR